jgi:hypothetical protein
MLLGSDASLAISRVIKGKYPTFGSKLYAAADKPLSPTKGRAP